MKNNSYPLSFGIFWFKQISWEDIKFYTDLKYRIKIYIYLTHMPVLRVKEYNTCHDELFVKNKNGLYRSLSIEKLHNNKKAVFKVGMTTQDLSSRTENYHSFFPMGVYIVFFLSYPRIKRGQDKGKLYRETERELISNHK